MSSDILKPFDMELATIEIEKLVAQYVGAESHELRKVHGDLLANELELTVSAIFMARVIANQHIYSRENLSKIRLRLMEAVEYHTRIFIEKIIEKENFNGARAISEIKKAKSTPPRI